MPQDAAEKRPLARQHTSLDGALQFRSLMEVLPAAADTYDEDGLITYFNEQGVELRARGRLGHRFRAR